MIFIFFFISYFVLAINYLFIYLFFLLYIFLTTAKNTVNFDSLLQKQVVNKQIHAIHKNQDHSRLNIV
jgi:hypothetical protein